MLDLEKETQKKILFRLAEQADLVVEDLGPDKADEMGIGYEELKKVKPDLLYLAITSFGRTGEFKDYPATDAVIQAMSGYMSLTSCLLYTSRRCWMRSFS